MNEGNFLNPNANASAPQIGVDNPGLDHQVHMAILDSPSSQATHTIANPTAAATITTATTTIPTTIATTAPTIPDCNNQGASNSNPTNTSDGQSPKQPENSNCNSQLQLQSQSFSSGTAGGNSNPGSQGSQQSINSPNNATKISIDHHQSTSNQSSTSNSNNNNILPTFTLKQEQSPTTDAYLAGRSSATLSDPSIGATPTPPSATITHLNNSNSFSITNASTPQHPSTSLSSDNSNGLTNAPILEPASNPGTSSNTTGNLHQTNGYTHPPLLNSKHLCLICGDKASGKHYGVYSCEGCKGFFKRTVRKGLTFNCRENSKCLIDKRQRNRCQFCRYKKCIDTGMRREAVQEERQRTKDSEDNEVESTSNSHIDTHFDRLVGTTSIGPVTLNGADSNGGASNVNMAGMHGIGLRGPTGILTNDPLAINNSGILTTADNSMKDDNNYVGRHNNNMKMDDLRTSSVLTHRSAFSSLLAQAAMNQIESLINWTKTIKEFRSLLIPDRLQLLKTYWNELILIDIAFRSMSLLDRQIVGLNIWSDIIISEYTAEEAGISNMFDRIQKEIVSKFREMQVDQREFILLKTIVLFNPEAQGLKTSRPIEDMRNLAFTELQNYCNQHHLQTQPNRFGKLLLRLPALRSIGLRCNDHPQRKLVFLQFDKEQDIDAYLLRSITSR